MQDFPLIFARSRPGRVNGAQYAGAPALEDVPAELLREAPPPLPEVSELQAVRHYTALSQRNFCIDTQFYPLGSCTMKYNPRAAHAIASLPGFAELHPLAPAAHAQGLYECLWELKTALEALTGMAEFSLAPLAGAQGELAGIAMIRAYHRARGDSARTEILVPDAAHGTNPASAVMCGYAVREVPTGPDGDVDLAALEAAVGPHTAGLMLTNPSTLGVFERRVTDFSRIVHGAGGLLYYDGANLNAIVGRATPGAMGFDVVHVNLHKTFSTPHGGGGPGAGPVGANARLAPYLPLPVLVRADDALREATAAERPHTIGRLSAFSGNTGVLLRAWAYLRLVGRAGLPRIAEHAVLSANYLMARLRAAGFELAFPHRRASHEFIVTLRRERETLGLTALDVAKRLLDHGIHAPTVYFPQLVPECLLIEPTETEDLATLDAFVDALIAIREEARTDLEHVRAAPHTTPVRRLDEVRAARSPDLAWQPEAS